MIWHIVNFHACFTHMWSEFGLWLLGTTLSASQLVVVVTKSCQDYCQPVDFQALLSMRFPSPGDLPNPRIMPVFCIAHGFLPPGHQGNIYRSIQFSHSVVSNSLRCHGLQHTRLPCPSPTPGTYSNSCHRVSDAIQPSHPLLSHSPSFSLPQHQGLLQWVSSLHQVAKVLELWLQCLSNDYSGLISFRMDWFDLLAIQGTLQSLLQNHSSKASILQQSAFFMVQLSHLYMTTGKTIALTRQTFVSKVMSLLFKMLSRLVIAFLPRIKHLLISWLQSPSAVISEPKKIKSITVSIFSPSICHEVMGRDTMILVFWMLSFKPALSLSSFTFIKRFFSSSSLSAIRVVSSAYLRLLIFLPENLIPACASSSLAFCLMYSAYKLNKQADNIQVN